METHEPQPSSSEVKEGHLKYFSIISSLFCAVLLISNITAVKVFTLGPLTVVGGVVLFPLAFIFNDILTEVYGFHLSRKVIWTAFACLILATFTYWIVGLIPPAAGWPHQQAYETILGGTPRVMLASMLAYFCGEFMNSLVISKMKYSVRGKRGLSEGWRFVASTIVGEGVDSVVFMTIAFYGVLPTPILVNGIISIYLLKVAYEIIATPFSTRFANWLKKAEGMDHLDAPQTTNYNPFALFSNK
jgi:hypothetical protein